MQTKKEAMLALLRGEKADFMPDPNSVIRDVLFPGERYIELGDKFDPYGTGPDAWGVLWTNQGPNPGIDGNMVAKGFKLFDDMDEWKEKVKFPPLDYMPLEQIFGAMCAGMHVDPETEVVSCLLLSGQFERMNQLIGMENALCAFYEYPDEVHEFFDAMCEYKLKCIDLAFKYLKPDVIHMHDDWGTNDNMFFSPEIWREFIKPNEEKYAKRIHELGGIYMHHSCGYIKQIIPDLVEIGVDAVNPMMINNDMAECLEKYGDKITFLGGIDSQMIDSEGTTEEQIRAEARRAMDAYVGNGRYLPYYIPIKAETFEIFKYEVTKYGADIFKKMHTC